MKRFKQILLLVLGAMFLTFAQPVVIAGHYLNNSPYFSLLSFFGLAPLLYLIYQEKWQGFWPGFTFALAYYFCSWFWIAYALTVFGNLPLIVGWAVLILLVFCQSLLIGLFSFLLSKISKKFFSLFLPALLWVAIEQFRNIYMGGFTWSDPAYGLARLPWFIQILDLAGIAGLTFIVVLTSTLIAIVPQLRDKLSTKNFKIEFSLALLLLLFIYPLYNGWRYSQRDELTATWPTKNIGLVQANISQGEKWKPFLFQAIVNKYLRATKTLAAQGATLAIWPEASLPRYLSQNSKVVPWPIMRKMPLPLIFGAVTYDQQKDGRKIYNSALLTNKNGKISGIFNKTIMVPFGEYVPWWVFIPVKKIVTAAGDFSIGQELKTLKDDKNEYGPLICYEAIFSHIARRHTRAGANLLVNITNDAWFGHSSGPYQSFYMSAFRAVENRIFLVRAANTGLSGYFDPFARSGAIIPFNQFGTKMINVKMKKKGSKLTIYNRFGYLFSWLCSFLAIFISLRYLYFKKDTTVS